MTDYNSNPQSSAEELIGSVFTSREVEADLAIARLRLENRLKLAPRRPRVRNTIKVAAFLTALVIIGGWATGLQVPTIDDAQQITIEMPDTFSPSSYPHWVAIFANNSTSLRDVGGHSLVVDFLEGNDGKYYLQLGIMGINYSEANSWIREVMSMYKDLDGATYAITQPLLPYRLTVKEMIAYQLGATEAVERNIVLAWLNAGERPKHIFLIARPKEYAERISNYLY